MTTLLRVSLVSGVLLVAQSGLFSQPQAPGPQGPEVYGQPSAENGPPPAGDGQEAEDIPGRGVVRISLINGDVSVKRGDSGEMIAAAVNAALLASDRVLTGTGARTELQLDPANRLRIASDSDLHLAEIEYRRYAVELGRGTITWHVARGSAADIDINTPSVSIRPTQPGDYRITVNDDGTTIVTARTGEAEIYSPKGVEKIRRGQTTLVRGEKSDPELQTIAEIREDEWDRFNVDRDRELDRSQSAQYLPDGVMGGEELDQNGAWANDPTYGPVWQPRVAQDWSPYSQGRWVWTDYYGWNWVSYDQFGWAPFHYGSWFSSGGRWCWYPGPRHVRTWWRPAMVAWFGFGNVRVGVGFGNWGWVPLAPFERYRPWYGRGYYGNNRTNIHANIRIVNNYNIVNNYRNARIAGGARGIDAGRFGRGGIGRYDRVNEANLRSAGLMQGQLPASPSRDSLSFNDRRVNTAGMRGGYQGAFFNRRPSVAQERIPFAEQQRGIERGARGFSGDPGVRGASFNAGRGENGWRRVGEPSVAGEPEGRDSYVRGNGAGLRGEGPAQRPEGNGWRRFGEPSSSSVDTARGSLRGAPSPGGAGRELDSSSVRGNGAAGGNGWRRFGEPSGQDSNDSVRNRREYGRSHEQNSIDNSVRTYRQPESGTSPQSFGQPRNQDRFEGYRSGPGNRPDSIRVNPPVLRDRSDFGRRGADSGPGAGSRRTSEGSTGGQYRPLPAYGGGSPGGGGPGSGERMRGGGGNPGSNHPGGGMRGGGGSAPSGGQSRGSGGSGGGGRGGGGRRGN